VRGFHLSVDYGTSNTVAVLRWPNGKTRALLFDGMPALSSAVYVEADGRFLVGRDAEQAAKRDPSRFEPNPKRHFESVELLLGDAVTPVEALVAATLRRVVDEAARTAGGVRPDAVVLTHPVAWGPQRRQILVNAAARAGLTRPLLVPEPVAAAMYYCGVVADGPVPGAIVVYSLGGGVCDVTLVRPSGTNPEVLGSGAQNDFGGVDLDSIVFAQIGAAVEAIAPEAWERLSRPTTDADRRLSKALWAEARAAKESLSRQPSVNVFVPVLERDVQLAREEFERAAAAALAGSADLARSVIEGAGLTPDGISAVFLVGGATRVPAVATVLHRALGIAPTVPEHPELVVSEGALHVPMLGPPAPNPSVTPVPPMQLPVPPIPQPVQHTVSMQNPAPVRPPRPAPVAHALPRPAPGPALMPIWPTHQAPAPPKRRVWPILVALLAIVLVGALVAAIVYAVKSVSDAAQNTLASSGPNRSPSAVASAEPVFAQLPDPCVLGQALPQQAASLKADPGNSTPDAPFCRWQLLQNDRAVYLRIKLESAKGGKARDTFAKELAYAGNTTENGGYRRNPTAVAGLGDEAFTAEAFSPITAGPSEAQAKTYEMGGAIVVVRARNVLIEVAWNGATYPAGAANGKVLRGTRFPYTQARDQAVAVARHLLSGLR
jgi:hypothetical protein